LKLCFDEPQLSITPGQIVAVYQDDLLLVAAL
jgi:tRNA U34 2-thiouridine synthase MnmA/TrmU